MYTNPSQDISFSKNKHKKMVALLTHPKLEVLLVFETANQSLHIIRFKGYKKPTSKDVGFTIGGARFFLFFTQNSFDP
ncbi:MAG: hypothetical protein PHG19_10760 [Anaerotignum sp.]|nr:hypothetical protein [Anaerotignum sp.]